MGSPTIFNGKFTKLLTNKSILNSDGSLLQYDGSKNYIPYAQFEQGVTTGWSLFNTTLTSGLPTGTVTAGAASLALTATSTNPLAGSYSMQLAAGTSWTAGQGVISSAFTVDRADLGKVITFKLYYEATVGGSSANWSGVVGSQSLAIYIYDVTASAWVQPAGFLGMNQNSGAGYVTGTFQSSVTSGQQYQIAIVALQAVASPLTITVDQVFVGPQTAPIGAVVTDWQSYTPTFQGFGTPTAVSCYWKRSGDSIEIKGKFTSGTSTAVQAQVSFPYNLTSDSTKISTIEIVGAAEVAAVGTVGQSVGSTFATLSEQSVQYITFSSRSSGTTGLSKLLGTSVASSGTVLSFYSKVPISGWSSNVQTSSDTDTRVVSARYSLSSGSPVSGSQVNFANIVYDTHAAVTTGASWKYTAPISGYYRVSLVLCTGSVNNIFALFKNGTLDSNMSYTLGSSATNNVSSSSTVLSLNAGDYFDVRPSTSNGSYAAGGGTGSSISTSNYITVERLSGPSVIAATETVAASYWCSANVSASTTQPINYDSKEFDLTNSVTTGSAWKFTAPVSGTYSVGYFIYTSNTSTDFKIYKNGSSYKNIGFTQTITGGLGESGNALIRLNAGDYIDFRPSGAVTVTGGVQTSNNCSQIYISRIGN